MNIAKVISAFVGVVIIIGSLGMVGAGAVALSASDADGYFTAGPVQLSTDSAALVGEDLDIFAGEPFIDRVTLDRIGFQLDVDSRNNKDVFVGIAAAEDLTRYLSDVRHASVELNRRDVVIVGHDGTSRVEIPGDQTFWVARATTDGTLTWDVENGRWAIALLNADGTPNVDVEVTAAARVPFVRPIGVGLLVVGLIGLLAGVGLTYLGVRSSPVRRATPSQTEEQLPVG
jgi:hypothetical protein